MSSSGINPLPFGIYSKLNTDLYFGCGGEFKKGEAFDNLIDKFGLLPLEEDIYPRSVLLPEDEKILKYILKNWDSLFTSEKPKEELPAKQEELPAKQEKFIVKREEVPEQEKFIVKREEVPEQEKFIVKQEKPIARISEMMLELVSIESKKIIEENENRFKNVLTELEAENVDLKTNKEQLMLQLENINKLFRDSIERIKELESINADLKNEFDRVTESYGKKNDEKATEINNLNLEIKCLNDIISVMQLGK